MGSYKTTLKKKLTKEVFEVQGFVMSNSDIKPTNHGDTLLRQPRHGILRTFQ